VTLTESFVQLPLFSFDVRYLLLVASWQLHGGEFSTMSEIAVHETFIAVSEHATYFMDLQVNETGTLSKSLNDMNNKCNLRGQLSFRRSHAAPPIRRT
jgi:hypothetical protein